MTLDEYRCLHCGASHSNVSLVRAPWMWLLVSSLDGALPDVRHGEGSGAWREIVGDRSRWVGGGKLMKTKDDKELLELLIAEGIFHDVLAEVKAEIDAFVAEIAKSSSRPR